MQTAQAPRDVRAILDTLRRSGEQAFLVGGCVRDMLHRVIPRDYDIATSAKPERVMSIFPHTIPTGIKYGTVTVLSNKTFVEVSTFRYDGTYSDGRRPDSVVFGINILDDLARRDFTINAMAQGYDGTLIDPYGGLDDLTSKVIRCVGNPDERFREDALRMLRAIRFACVLGFSLDPNTAAAIKRNNSLLTQVSNERIRDELTKILTSNMPAVGLTLLAELDLLHVFLPELEACRNFDQHNPHHRKDVFRHILSVIQKIPHETHLRLAALLHDIAKPLCFIRDKQGIGHFYGHDEKGAEMAEIILRRLCYDKDTITKVCFLIREHMFPGSEMGQKGIRRFISRIGSDRLEDLLILRRADAKGGKFSSGQRRLSYLSRIRRICREMQAENVIDPRKSLAIDGHDIMEELGISPGQRVGKLLAMLMQKIVDEPELNKREVLLTLIRNETEE